MTPRTQVNLKHHDNTFGLIPPTRTFYLQAPLRRRCKTGSRPSKMPGIPFWLYLQSIRSPRLFLYPRLKAADLKGLSHLRHLLLRTPLRPLHHLNWKMPCLQFTNVLIPQLRRRNKVLFLWHHRSQPRRRTIQPKLS